MKCSGSCLISDKNKEAIVIRRIFSLFDRITKAKFSNSSNDFKFHLFR